MKMLYVPASPYARKALVTAIEKGLDSRIERVKDNPWEDTTKVPDFNPAGRVPTLIRDDGSVLFNSPLVCEYLDSIGTGPALLPASGEPRWTALRQQAMGDLMLDAIVIRISEIYRRPKEKQHMPVVERQDRVFARTLDALEREASNLAGPITIGPITIGVVLGHVDFRKEMLGGLDWRAGRPKLTAWFETFNQRPSMQATIPHV